MNAVVFAFTERGKGTALRLRDLLRGEDFDVRLAVPARLADDTFPAYAGGLPDYTGAMFNSDALVFVGAAGIAVRAIAPHVASKKSDPAVLCVDEAARFVIPVLSGHIGGANRLARDLAAAIGAVPVITTATDVNGRFSVDTWATEHGMAITSMALAKRVSAEILTRDIPIWSDAEPPKALPEGLLWSKEGELGICVSPRDLHPFKDTLLLVPKALRLGIGCRRGTPREAVEAAVLQVLADNHLRPEAVAEAASIDVKSDEPGLIECCGDRGWPLSFHTAEELAALKGSFTPSEFVRNTVGVDNVCERAAAASGGRIIVPKTAMNGVTVAVAELKWGIEFV